jgi:hypothetical protein
MTSCCKGCLTNVSTRKKNCRKVTSAPSCLSSSVNPNHHEGCSVGFYPLSPSYWVSSNQWSKTYFLHNEYILTSHTIFHCNPSCFQALRPKITCSRFLPTQHLVGGAEFVEFITASSDRASTADAVSQPLFWFVHQYLLE